MKNTFSLLSLIFTACLVSIPAMAQLDPPPGIPLDGGASLLVAAGIGFGIKKYVDYRKQQKQS